MLLSFILGVLALPLKSKIRIEAENAALRHQVLVLRRQVRGRVHLANFDRLSLVQLYQWCPSISRALTSVEPKTVVRWHRAGFRAGSHVHGEGGRRSAQSTACIDPENER